MSLAVLFDLWILYTDYDFRCLFLLFRYMQRSAYYNCSRDLSQINNFFFQTQVTYMQTLTALNLLLNFMQSTYLHSLFVQVFCL